MRLQTPVLLICVVLMLMISCVSCELVFHTDLGRSDDVNETSSLTSSQAEVEGTAMAGVNLEGLVDLEAVMKLGESIGKDFILLFYRLLVISLYTIACFCYMYTTSTCKICNNMLIFNW